jgi:group I intron endonuclease
LRTLFSDFNNIHIFPAVTTMIFTNKGRPAALNNLTLFACGPLWGTVRATGSLTYFSTSSASCSPIIPVKHYSNADTQKNQIMLENKDKSGIYRWVNLENSKSYVGSAVHITKRFRDYSSKAYAERYSVSSLICKALCKHGTANFTYEVLEYCEKSVLLEREQYYLDLLKPEYNILATAGSILGYKHTEVSLAKMRGRVFSEAHIARLTGHLVSDETRQRISEALTGRVRSDEFKSKLRFVSSNKSEGHRAKISAANGTKVLVTNLESGITLEYVSMRAAARELDCSVNTIRRHIKSNKPIRGIYQAIEKSLT